MFSQVGCDYVFEHFAQNTCERDRAIICRVWLVSFFEDGRHVCFFPDIRKLPGVKWLEGHLQYRGKFCMECLWHYGLNWSGPTALWRFRDLSRFSMPFTEICIWGIWLYGLDWKGKLRLWSLVLEVFVELRNLSIPEIWDWKQTGIVCLGHLISHNRQRGSFRPTSVGLPHLSLVLNAWVVNISF